MRTVLAAVAVMFLTHRSSAFTGLMRTRGRKLSVRMSLLDDFTSKSAVDSMLANVMDRAASTLATKQELENEAKPKKLTPQSGGYAGNPCVHFTSLAHLQWKYVLRPGVDAAIDATCGNGYDSKKLAEFLFQDGVGGNSELLCIDVQDAACEATRRALEENVSSSIMDNHIQILQQSHAPLPTTSAPLALACWNLGYLPNADDKSTCTTMESSIQSMSDAALQLRVGGLLSVMTYPKSNPNEDYAVHVFFEALALLSSKQVDWREYLENLGPDPVVGDNEYTVRDTVTQAICRIVEQGAPKQTWRAMEHKMMGRALSPMLLTVSRVK